MNLLFSLDLSKQNQNGIYMSKSLITKLEFIELFCATLNIIETNNLSWKKEYYLKGHAQSVSLCCLGKLQCSLFVKQNSGLEGHFILNYTICLQTN